MAQFLTLSCPSCGGKTTYQAGDPRVVCQYCGNEHLFQLYNRPELTPRTWLRSKPRQPRPRNVRIEQKKGELRLVWRWFSPKYIPLAFFCIAWDAFLIFWYSMAFGMDAPWIMIVFPIAHLAVGVGLTYSTLAGFLNSTTVRLGDESFSVQHDPLPWMGEVKVPRGELRQFYCREQRPKNSEGANSYQLVAVLEDGRQLDLVSNLDSPDIGWFLEQQLESHLGIQDEPVPDELLNWA
jgi:hypothetical protein